MRFDNELVMHPAHLAALFRKHRREKRLKRAAGILGAAVFAAGAWLTGDATLAVIMLPMCILLAKGGE